MKRLVAIAASITVAAAGLAAVPAATASPGQPARPGKAAASTPSYTPPPLSWSPCPSGTLKAIGAECSTLVVPLDYARPKGRKISLAVSRVKHRSSQADYQGIMLTNPGGPGGSGLVLSVLGYGPIVPGNADDDYDWIGFDPRGVGASRPALSCDGQYFGYDRPSYVPSTSRGWRPPGCGSRAATPTTAPTADARRLLDHVKTTDTVNDMESLRKALHRGRINYYGFSYGTYLGQVYATLHPNRVRRFVLDGNVDPRRVFYKANLDQDRAFDSRPSTCTSAGWPSTTTSTTSAPTPTRDRARLLRELPQARRRTRPPAARSARTSSTDVMLVGRLLRLRLGGHRGRLRQAGQRR